MAARHVMVVSLIVILLTNMEQTHAISHRSSPNSTLDYLERTLNGLELAMDFFRREHKHVNLDALIGTRIAEASFTVLLKRLDSTGLIRHIPLHIIDGIRQVRNAASNVTTMSLPYVIDQEPDYYENIGPMLVKGLFELDYKSRDLPSDFMKWPYSEKETMKELHSDACIAEILGTRNGVPCDITRGCWNVMTKVGYSKYSLSHEIFYLQIAEMYGCEAEMQWFIDTEDQGSVTQLQDLFCGNMFKEAQLFADNKFPKYVQDLFMEQAGLCGMYGYREFFTSEWLANILSWQDPKRGCYYWDEWPLKHSQSLHHHRITKREEKRVSNGCMCHRTTVAVAALSQYTRYIMEVWLQEHGLLE